MVLLERCSAATTSGAWRSCNVVVPLLGVYDMFHDMFPSIHDCVPICFTICLFISPDLDGHRAAPKSSNGHFATFHGQNSNDSFQSEPWPSVVPVCRSRRESKTMPKSGGNKDTEAGGGGQRKRRAGEDTGASSSGGAVKTEPVEQGQRKRRAREGGGQELPGG